MKAHLALVLPLALAASACIYENEPPRRLVDAPPPEPSADSPSPPSSAAPMLVEVDADQTMTAVGGDGVGVFVEYAKGGHWHLTWTCDTNYTQKSCDFAIDAAAASGTITNVDSSGAPPASVTTPMAARVEIRTTTTTELHSVRFDTSAGAVITLEAAVGAIRDGGFFFFVQDGKVNGGFAGALTNPLQLQGSTP
jgi:hypothetical protein